MARLRAWHALAGLIGITVILSIYPFAPLRTPGEMVDIWAGFFSFAIEPPAARTIIERIVTLVPAGFLVGRMIANRPLPGFCALVLAGAAGISFGLEALQFPFAPRHPHSSDALIAFWCAFVGIMLATHRFDRRMIALRAVLTIGACVSIAMIGSWVLVGPSTSNWNCSYPVVAGDEIGGGRAWTGEISGLAVYPARLSPDTIAALSRLPFSTETEAARDAEGAAWVFSGDDGAGTPARPMALGTPGMAPEPVALMSGKSGRTWCRQVKATGAVAIEMKIRALREEQSGPARIVSFSRSPYERNITAGQEGSAFDLRMRTRSSGINGEIFVVRTPERAVQKRWQHVVMIYDRAEASIFVDGELRAGPVAFAGIAGNGASATGPALLTALWLGFCALGLMLNHRRPRRIAG